MKKPITVLMAVYNEKAVFLRKSIESVLNQTFSDFEFLIINDGSTDQECLRILGEYAEKDSRISLASNEKNVGLSRSLNRGLEMAEGKYIARMDSDDTSDPARLEKQFDFMEKNPDYALCGSWSYIMDENDNIIGEKKFFSGHERIRRNLLYFNFFTHSTFFFRKNTILESGGYDEKLKKAQDYDLLLKISAKNKIENMQEFLCSNRIHSKSISAKGKKRQEWCTLVAKFRAVFRYGYPKLYFYKIIPSLFYFLLVPHSIEKLIFKSIWKKYV